MLGTTWQRCRVHLARNVLAKVPKGSADMVAAAMRTIYAQPDAAHVARPVRRDRRHAHPPVPRRRRRSSPTPATTCSPSPRSPKRTGARSGPPTRSNASTARSNAAPASSGSSPTTPPCCASSAPSSPKPTTNGKTPNAATSPNTPWHLLYEPATEPARHQGGHACKNRVLNTSQPDTQTFTRDGSYTTRGGTAGERIGLPSRGAAGAAPRHVHDRLMRSPSPCKLTTQDRVRSSNYSTRLTPRDLTKPAAQFSWSALACRSAAVRVERR